jgi:hypothetical protein
MPLSNTKVAGILLLVGGIQFVIALVIAEAVYPGYSVSANYISDLGVWGKPSAPVFNPSTMLFGLTVLASSYFIHKHFGNRAITVLFALAGAGALGVGIFPESTFIVNGIPRHPLHLGASRVHRRRRNRHRILQNHKTPVQILISHLGSATLTAAVLFATTRDIGYLGIGVGGMERMIAYPTLL